MMTVICKVYDSMYGGYFGEVLQYDGDLLVDVLSSYHAKTIKALKEMVKNAWGPIEFVRIK